MINIYIYVQSRHGTKGHNSGQLTYLILLDLGTKYPPWFNPDGFVSPPKINLGIFYLAERVTQTTLALHA